MISSFIIGLFVGFFLSVPIGPINLTVINEAFRKGFSRAVLIGLGGIVADIFYCTMAFFGFSSVLAYTHFLWPFLQFAGGIIVFVIGIRYAIRQNIDFSPITRRAESRIGHFTKAFPIGFVMGISNLSLFVLWGGVNTILISYGLIKPTVVSMLMCILGIMLGSSIWFVGISLLISKMHRQIHFETISRITRICGFLLLFFGIYLCYHSLFGTRGSLF